MPLVKLNMRNPSPRMENPTSTILREPNRSVKYPSTGPITVPSRRARANAPDRTVLLHPKWRSSATKKTPSPCAAAPFDRAMVNMATPTSHHP